VNLTLEDRRMLASAYELMAKEALAGDTDAFEGLADPFWRAYADTLLCGFDVVMAGIERLRRARKPRRLLNRGATMKLERTPTGRRSHAH